MNQATLQQLVRKYIDNTATPEERQELLEWYRKKSNSSSEWISDNLGEENIVRERILANIKGKRFNPGTKIYKTYYAAAAAILIFLSFAALFYFKAKPTANKFQSSNNTIHAGKNEAMLILADGSKILLNDKKDGVLAKQGSAVIKRAANGQIIYDLSSVKNTEINNTLAFNTIVTPRGGQYSIILPDGSNVWLNSESSLKFPTGFKGKERNVQLTGEAYFEVAKNKDMPFKVNVRGTEVEVLGTHFNINAYDEESSVNTTLLEGSVKVSHDNISKIIKPGQQAQVSKNIEIQDVDAEQFIAWKNGFFVFNDEDIHTLMNRIARWYDVDVKYEEDMGNLKFSGSISKYKDVSQILKKLELTKTIHFKIEGRRIAVMK